MGSYSLTAMTDFGTDSLIIFPLCHFIHLAGTQSRPPVCVCLFLSLTQDASFSELPSSHPHYPRGRSLSAPSVLWASLLLNNKIRTREETMVIFTGFLIIKCPLASPFLQTGLEAFWGYLGPTVSLYWWQHKDKFKTILHLGVISRIQPVSFIYELGMPLQPKWILGGFWLCAIKLVSTWWSHRKIFSITICPQLNSVAHP